MTAVLAAYVRTPAEPEVQRADVVIVPGLAVSRYLRPTADRLAERGVRCELLDLPGFGDSANPPRPLGVHQFAAVVVDYLRGRDGPPVTLVGHSSGTQVAALAAAHTDVAHLVLASPTVDPHFRRLPRLLAQWMRDGRIEPDSLAPIQRPEWRRAGVRRIVTLLRSMRRHRLEATLADLTGPITVVRAERDPLCTQEWAARLAEGHELVVVPDLPHAFPYLDPSGFAELILHQPVR